MDRKGRVGLHCGWGEGSGLGDKGLEAGDRVRGGG